MWQLRYQRDGFSIDAAIEKGRDLPDWYFDEPLSLPGDERYLDAFWILTTERFWSTGPIPSTMVSDYAFRNGFPTDMIASFTRILRKIDDAYLGWVNKEIERQRQQDKGKSRWGRMFRKPK